MGEVAKKIKDLLKTVDGHEARAAILQDLVQEHQAMQPNQPYDRSSLITNSGPNIDHIVLRCRTKETLADSIEFYKQIFGFTIDREQEYQDLVMQKPEMKGKIVFPGAKINPFQTIDLFPEDVMKPLYPGKVGPEQNFDHFCLNFTGEQLLKLVKSEHPLMKGKIERVFGRVGKEGKSDMGPHGSQGTGCSVYLYDPNGMYLECRTYDKSMWKEIEDATKARIAKEKEDQAAAPSKL